MELTNEYIVLLIMVAILLSAIIFIIKKFFGMPKEEQLEKIREWLLYAVTIAEKEYGSGTGKLKLRYVYDLFITKFGWMASLITFDMFSEMVDKSLEEMRTMLEQNERFAAIVNGEES